MRRRTFRAMGTDIELLVDAENGDGTLDAAEAEFHRLEAILSRFRPESELSRLNEAGAADAGPELVALTSLSLAARELTGGRFDPTVHDAVMAAGYDRTFDDVAPDGPDARPVACGGRVRVEGSRIELDAASASTSAASGRAGPPTRSRRSSPRPGPVLSTRAATSPSAAAPGPSASRR